MNEELREVYAHFFEGKGFLLHCFVILVQVKYGSSFRTDVFIDEVRETSEPESRTEYFLIFLLIASHSNFSLGSPGLHSTLLRNGFVRPRMTGGLLLFCKHEFPEEYNDSSCDSHICHIKH